MRKPVRQRHHGTRIGQSDSALKDERNGTNDLLLLAIAALALYPLLLHLRQFDDNTLTSWRWAAANADLQSVFLLHVLGVGAAFLLSRYSFPERIPHLAPPLLALFLAPLFWGIPEVVIDASRYFTQAKHLEVYGYSHFFREWGREIDAWTDLPMPALLYGTLFTLFGESRLAAQILNTILLSGTSAATFLTIRLLWGSEAGFLAGLLLLGIPYLFIQVPLMLSDVTAMFFFALTVYLAVACVRKGGKHRLFATVPAFAGAFLSKYSLWPAVFLFLALVPAARPPAVPWRVILSRTGALFLTAAAVPAILLTLKGDVILAQTALLLDYQWSGLQRWGESPASTLLFQIHPFITLLALFAALVAVRRKDPSILVAAVLPLLMILLQIRRVRYLVIIFPLLAATAAYGLCALADRRFRRFAAYSVVSFSFVTALFLYRPLLRSFSLGNLQAAAAVLNATGQERVEVYVSDHEGSAVNPAIAVPLLDLYSTGMLTHHNGGEGGAGKEQSPTSPFRFSWRYRSPEYYRAPRNREKMSAVAHVSAEAGLQPDLTERTAGYRRLSFHADEGLFRYRTLVTLFIPPDRAR